MPKAHIVNLSYVAGGVKPDPDPVLVKEGDTLKFKVIEPPSGKVHVKINDPDSYAPPDFKDGDAPVKVRKATRTTYDCTLFVNGQQVAATTGSQGGGIEPDRTP